MERDQQWLEELFAGTWRDHFADTTIKNPIIVRFGRNARTRLGSIRFHPGDKTAIITLTGLFRYREVPEFVVRATLIHELCHYAHGFHSGHRRQHRYPHAGGVIRKEFAERQLGGLYDRQQQWLRDHWPQFVSKHAPPKRRSTTKSRRPRFKIVFD